MNRKNIILLVFVLLPLIIAFVNDYFAKTEPLSWSRDNLNTISLVCLFVSLIAAVALLSNSNKLWLKIFGGAILLFDVVFIFLVLIVSNFGF